MLTLLYFTPSKSSSLSSALKSVCGSWPLINLSLPGITLIVGLLTLTFHPQKIATDSSFGSVFYYFPASSGAPWLVPGELPYNQLHPLVATTWINEVGPEVRRPCNDATMYGGCRNCVIVHADIVFYSVLRPLLWLTYSRLLHWVTGKFVVSFLKNWCWICQCFLQDWIGLWLFHRDFFPITGRTNAASRLWGEATSPWLNLSDGLSQDKITQNWCM